MWWINFSEHRSAVAYPEIALSARLLGALDVLRPMFLAPFFRGLAGPTVAECAKLCGESLREVYGPEGGICNLLSGLA